MIKNGIKATLATTLLLIGSTGAASASVMYSQGFETDTSGWNTPENYGSVARVASGTNGVAAYEGDWYGTVAQTSSAPYTWFDGRQDTFTPWSTQTAIFLDTSWDLGAGFNYSVASAGTDNAHQRDFIFHVTQDTSTGDLMVGGSNNTNFAPREDLENINSFVVDNSGWYIFEHVFRNEGGTLAVDLNLHDALGNTLFTETRNAAVDTIPDEVGGSFYGWFTNIDVEGGIAIDSTTLTREVSEPSTLAIFGLGLLAAVRLRRKM